MKNNQRAKAELQYAGTIGAYILKKIIGAIFLRTDDGKVQKEFRIGDRLTEEEAQQLTFNYDVIVR